MVSINGSHRQKLWFSISASNNNVFQIQVRGFCNIFCFIARFSAHFPCKWVYFRLAFFQIQKIIFINWLFFVFNSWENYFGFRFFSSLDLKSSHENVVKIVAWKKMFEVSGSKKSHLPSKPNGLVNIDVCFVQIYLHNRKTI